MGNQQAMCCADTTAGCQRVDLVSTSSYDGLQNRGKTRLLRRFIETFRQAPRRDQVAHQSSSFFKRKFASSNMEMDPMGVDGADCLDEGDKQQESLKKAQVAFGWELQSSTPAQDSISPRHIGNSPQPQSQLRSLSSISTQSEFGERAREARSEQVTRRTSYCSDREGIEDEREPLEPEGSFLVQEATE